MLNNKQFAALHSAIAQQKAGQPAEAAKVYAQLRAQVPDEFDPYFLGGLAALQCKSPEEALPLLERARAMNPKHHDAVFHLGSALADVGRHVDAEKHLRAAIQLKENFTESWNKLAYTLRVLNRLDEAMEAARKAISLSPNQAGLWCNLGICQALKHQSAEAVLSYEKALSMDPETDSAYYGRAMAYQQIHCISKAVADYERYLKKHPQHREATSYRLLALHYLSGYSRETLSQDHLAFGKLFETPEQLALNAARRFPCRPDPERKLRIAFLSPDLRTHPVSFFLQPLLANLDRERFEVILYHDHPKEDAFSAVLKKYVRGWRNFVGMPDQRVEAQIRADSVDILIDLAGHTGLNRLHLFARRLAPVQITYLGYPDTTGLKSMDYRLTDGIADPEGDADAFYTEKQIRFSNTAWCFWPPLGSPEPAPPPSAAGAPVVFGCFNSLSKISEKTVELWSKILAAAPESKILIKTLHPGDRDIAAELQALGTDPARLVHVPTTPNIIEHLRAYSAIDIALDPFPYHGTTSTCEALWMGVPVISLRGDRHCSRVGASLLTAVGHPEWIAESEDDYVAKAAALAADRVALATLRQNLRVEMQASALLDGKGQAQRFGEALRGLWRTWCVGP